MANTKALGWYVCTCPEHGDESSSGVPCEGILIFATCPEEARALAWADVPSPEFAIVRREPIADAYTHLALGSAIPRPTYESPPSQVRVYRHIGYGPINNGKRCIACLKAEWLMVDESIVCEDCGLCEECHPEGEEE